jgi:MoCo/4Fe-4S cofactor protein with predicted Tat translocation signal
MAGKEHNHNFASLRDKVLAQNGKEYWRSVEEFVDAPEFEEFVKQEYPAHAEEWDNGLSRRNFIKVMGASLAFAGLSGCVIQPAEKIVPYVRQQEELLPGKALFFATAMSLGGVATGLLGKSFEGRPVKIEGNPEHPGSLGATDVLAQASLLGMYDPDRSQEITYRGDPKTWQSFMTELRAKVDENRVDGGAGIRFLTETVTSPTLIGQFRQIATELPNSRWTQYEPINKDNATEGAKMAFGSPVNTIYKFDLAEKIVTLDADIFSNFNVRYMKDFAKGRAFAKGKKEINRLYAVESTITLTGAKADHRLTVKPSQVAEVAKALANAVGVSGAAATGLSADAAKWVAALAKDLQASRGKSIVAVGDNQSPMVHALAHAINASLGNVGQTVVYTEPLAPFTEKSQAQQLRELVADIDSGKVKMLVILGGNPVYNTPADLKLSRERLDKIPLRVHLGQHVDETAELCQWHVAEKHFLETWSDARAYDGTVSVIQPLIQPIYDGKSIHEVVQLFLKENYDKKDYDVVKEFWQKQSVNMTSTAPTAQTAPKTAENATPTGTPQPAATPAQTTAVAPAAKNFEDNWRKIIHDGIVPNSASAAKTVTANTAFLSQPSAPPANSGTLEISILPDPCVYDGRFANNGWLQELPNPLNKITWDNVALISPRTAERLKINQGNDEDEMSGGVRGTAFVNTKGGNMSSDLVKLNYQGAEISQNVPMWITPGQPDDVITIYMGYGRAKAGKIGTGLGYNAFDVRRSDAMNYGTGEIVKTGEATTIASTQIHFNMEGRDLLRVWEFEEVEELGKQSAEHEKKHSGYDKSMYEPFNYSEYEWQHKWGMTIDLNNCVGCNACVIACQSENNIPVVGKEQIERSREMHWMRIDTYYGGQDVNSPDGPHFQPVLCQQCEQAPCEVVCPVHATVHSAEGLNDMVYNRCVGTRYCSNNCPYKVRRFNFLLYQDWNTPQYKLMRNPEVTVRSRGVMEKCTYCVQRIAAARIEGRKENRRIRDGEVITACQSVCPTEAITFGDLNDKESNVAKMKDDPRNYSLLAELNTQPRTTYLAGLRNQNKEMPDYKAPKPGEVHSEDPKNAPESH